MHQLTPCALGWKNWEGGGGEGGVYHMVRQPAASAKLRAKSVLVSTSCHVMIVSSAAPVISTLKMHSKRPITMQKSELTVRYIRVKQAKVCNLPSVFVLESSILDVF